MSIIGYPVKFNSYRSKRFGMEIWNIRYKDLDFQWLGLVFLGDGWADLQIFCLLFSHPAYEKQEAKLSLG